MIMTTRKRHSPEQLVRKLATEDQMLGVGKDVADVCRVLQISGSRKRCKRCDRLVLVVGRSGDTV